MLPSYLLEPRSETVDIADFMEEEREAEPTYKAMSAYSRLDAQQVDLREGQVVRVIEKHDTGGFRRRGRGGVCIPPLAHLRHKVP